MRANAKLMPKLKIMVLIFFSLVIIPTRALPPQELNKSVSSDELSRLSRVEVKKESVLPDIKIQSSQVSFSSDFNWVEHWDASTSQWRRFSLLSSQMGKAVAGIQAKRPIAKGLPQSIAMAGGQLNFYAEKLSLTQGRQELWSVPHRMNLNEIEFASGLRHVLGVDFLSMRTLFLRYDGGLLQRVRWPSSFELLRYQSCDRQFQVVVMQSDSSGASQSRSVDFVFMNQTDPHRMSRLEMGSQTDLRYVSSMGSCQRFFLGFSDGSRIVELGSLN